ncbi:uncharacterized protein A1O9_04150 [Exophiala aquamarina CBS 119918]|uniref:Uncharacterized protein n=1 Tax=Exophiala aquamarina CBS 119918 TaxID=1182545 RepID=A0A072PHJ5_9EURO|nr:uncharacterized protein A1O9_04150 [Exophiala aquamarina CBS 119918]KEF59306.1 hypothetical protein A1O9_04150 [Exophiala aquamarina CBS 119918]
MEPNQKEITLRKLHNPLMDHVSDPMNSANLPSNRPHRSTKQPKHNPTTISDESEEEAKHNKRLKGVNDVDAEYKPTNSGKTQPTQREYYEEALTSVKGKEQENSGFGPADAEAADWTQPWLPKDLKDAHRRIVKLTQERNTIKSVKQTIKKRNTELREEAEKQKFKFQELSDQLQAANEKNRDLERTFREIQDEQLRLIGKDKIPCEPDSEVSADLAKIFRSSKSWASRWSIADWTDLSDSEIGGIISCVRKVADEPLATERFTKLMESKQVPPRMITNALINRFICHFTLQSPFKHLLWNEHDQNDSTVETASKGAANKLRVNILRAIDRPRSTAEPQYPSTESDKAIHRRAAMHCGKVTLWILSQSNLLLRPVEQDQQRTHRYIELLTIVTDALSLSRSLSHQYPFIGVFFLDDEEMKNQLFKINHPVFQAHRGMKLREDEEDDDGHDPRDLGILDWPLDFVVEPCIKRAGDDEGENYEDSKILHKAIVWMVSDAELNQSTRIQRKKAPLLKDWAHKRTSTGQNDVSNIPTTPPLNPIRDHGNAENQRKGESKKSRVGYDQAFPKIAKNNTLGDPLICTRETIRQTVVAENFGSSSLLQGPRKKTVKSSQPESRTPETKSGEFQHDDSTNMGQAADDNQGRGRTPSADNLSKKRKRSNAEGSDGSSGRARNREDIPPRQIKREY